MTCLEDEFDLIHVQVNKREENMTVYRQQQKQLQHSL